MFNEQTLQNHQATKLIYATFCFLFYMHNSALEDITINPIIITTFLKSWKTDSFLLEIITLKAPTEAPYS